MNLKKLIINTILIFLLCSLFHFGYDVFKNAVTSILFPVNESIWEHLKMIFTADLIFSIIASLLKWDYCCFTKGFLRGLLTSIILLIIYLPVYYLFGEILIVTMIILIISIFLTEVLLAKLSIQKHHKKLNILGAFLLLTTYFLFYYLTYYPIENDLFYDHKNKKYGIDILNK